MRIVFFSHPTFLDSQSMPRYCSLLTEAMKQRNHAVEVWSPQPVFYKLKSSKSLKKWLGYIDQYVLFPNKIRRQLRNYSSDTLFVFTDHALGPWVPLVKDRHHIIHCHDFLAQQSAKGLIPEHKTSFTGKIYQSYIRKGYRTGKNFISVSKKTQSDLHNLLNKPPRISEVVYNPMNRFFSKADDVKSLRTKLGSALNISLENGFILHVGGNQWYKNRIGVLEIYDRWRNTNKKALPLLLVGSEPDLLLSEQYDLSIHKSDIYFLPNRSDDFVSLCYQSASVLLFPSFAEGFGWPIAEAMASGCLVITTGKQPMTEVGLQSAYYINPKPKGDFNDTIRWAEESAAVLQKVLTISKEEYQGKIEEAMANVKRFEPDVFFNTIEGIYQKILTAS